MKKALLVVSLVLATLGAAGLMLLSVYLGAPVIEITNRSGFNVKKVTVRGRGFDQELRDLLPDETVRVEVHPRGESGLEVVFTSRGKEYRFDDLAYIEGHGGYCIDLVIDKNLSVKPVVTNTETFCPRWERIWWLAE